MYTDVLWFFASGLLFTETTKRFELNWFNVAITITGRFKVASYCFLKSGENASICILKTFPCARGCLRRRISSFNKLFFPQMDSAFAFEACSKLNDIRHCTTINVSLRDLFSPGSPAIWLHYSFTLKNVSRSPVSQKRFYVPHPYSL